MNRISPQRVAEIKKDIDDILKEKNIFLEERAFRILLKSIEANIDLVGDEYAVCIGYHMLDINDQSNSLYYTKTNGLKLPSYINSKIKDIIESENVSLAKLVKDISINRFIDKKNRDQTKTQIHEKLITEDENKKWGTFERICHKIKDPAEILRAVLNLNMWTQNIAIGAYANVIRERKLQCQYPYRISLSDEEVKDFPDKIYWNYVVVTTLESFFLDKEYWHKYLNEYKTAFLYFPDYQTWLYGKPVFLYNEIPVGDFFIALTEVGGYQAIEVADILFDEIDDRIEREIVSILRSSYSNSERNQYALKAAIAAIMSRNGSHNIGSHVINRVVESIDSLNIQDHKYFLRYLQQRMDFIAQIATEFPKWTTSHWCAKEIMMHFYEQRHLLNYIARSEGLKALENDDTKGLEKVNCIIKNISGYKCDAVSNKCKKRNIKCPECTIKEKKGNQIVYCTDEECSSDLSKDMMLSVPGGLLGFHAFYTIIENFLRNAAKHCYARYPESHKNKPMIITIELWNYENDDQYYTVRIWDNYSYISGMINDYIVDTAIGDLSRKYIKVYNASEYLEKVDKEQVNPIIESCPADNQPKSSENNEVVFLIVDDEKTLLPESLLKKDTFRFLERVFVEDFFQGDSINRDALITSLEQFYIPTHININQIIIQPLINENGSLNKSHWGIGEMKIASGYLQGRSLKEIGGSGEDNLYKLIRAIPVPDRNKDGGITAYRLGYEFKVQKPIDIIMLGYQCSNEDKIKMKQEGIIILDELNEQISTEFFLIYDAGCSRTGILADIEEFSNTKSLDIREKIKLKIEDFPTRFFIVSDDDVIINHIHEDPFLKKRIITISSKDLIEGLSIKDDNDTGARYEYFKNNLRGKWLRHIRDNIRSDINADLVLNMIIDPEGQDNGTDVAGLSKMIGWILVLNEMNAINKKSKEDLFRKVFNCEIKKTWQLKEHLRNHYSIDKNILEDDDVNSKINFYRKAVEAIFDLYGIHTGNTYKPPTLPAIYKSPKETEEEKKVHSEVVIDCDDDLKKIAGFKIYANDCDIRNFDNIIEYNRHKSYETDGKDYFYFENLSGAAAHFHILAHPPEKKEELVVNLFENSLLTVGRNVNLKLTTCDGPKMTTLSLS